MDKKILPLRCYNLGNANGNKLRLYLGRYECCERGEYPASMDGHISNLDKGYRWSFVGFNIPVPIRSGEWFNGFPEPVMLDWLKGNGWLLRTSVCMEDGRATVYDLPTAAELESSKGNPATIGNADIDDANRHTFRSIIKELCEFGRKVEAVRLYRYAHGGDLKTANAAVNEIRDGDR